MTLTSFGDFIQNFLEYSWNQQTPLDSSTRLLRTLQESTYSGVWRSMWGMVKYWFGSVELFEHCDEVFFSSLTVDMEIQVLRKKCPKFIIDLVYTIMNPCSLLTRA